MAKVTKIYNSNNKVSKIKSRDGLRFSTTRIKEKVNRKTGEFYTKHTTRSFDGFGILKAIMLILLIAGIFNVFTNSSEKSFYSFLMMLQDVPDIFPVQDLIKYFSFTEFALTLPNWLTWLAPILEVLSGFMTICAFILKGLISALTLIFYFCRWLIL